MKKIFFALFFMTSFSFAARGPSDPFPAGFTIFPATSVWNTNIENAVVSSSNTLWMDASNGHSFHNLHADFGTTYLGDYNGIPYNLVWSSSTARINVPITSYATESDTPPVGGIPIPADAIAENDPSADPNGDRHLLIVDLSSNTIYEMAFSSRTGGGNWQAGQLSIFHSTSNYLRPDDFTSADAAGLPILPGLIRYDEIQAGAINHALRFTLVLTHGPHIWPARHDANSGGTLNPPFGMRVRMKSSYTNSLCSSTTNQIILTALKKYGMFMADNGGDWFVSGAPNPAWDPADLATCFNSIIPYYAFEVIDESSWIVDPNTAQALSPIIPRTIMRGSVQIQ